MGILAVAEEGRVFGQMRLEALLRVSWEAEYLGAGMMEELAEMYPQHAEILTACANMEWFNIDYCKKFCEDANMKITDDHAEKVFRMGAMMARRTLGTFEAAAKLLIFETPAAILLYSRLKTIAGNPELKALADDLIEHESVMRDWFKSELEGESDGGRGVFAYLERHGIGRTEAVTRRPRKGSITDGGIKTDRKFQGADCCFHGCFKYLVRRGV
ncbi:unnamed protein product [Symbiodinium necroappetens]|uniref:Uncharacterized protein n=1 Tax=Symbiodinium necroappetens TaxID=1628268 RepID=A0A812XY19_9DINO|nr:unnamed protein product [Symbiodinium necroappetens]